METNKIYHGDSLSVLKTFPDESIDCVMTSPPYFGQRDYDVDGQLGLEKTPDEFVEKLVAVFDEIKRVLKKTGSCWVNLGDCYGGFQGKNAGYPDNKTKASVPQIKRSPSTAKSLLCVPEKFLIEMTNRGWIIRNKIIWHKNNVMPSSSKDRFTIDYEMLFFFVKSKKYYFDQQFEPFVNNSDVEHRKKLRAGKRYDLKKPYEKNTPYAIQKRNKEIVEYRNLPDIKEFSKYINDKRKECNRTVEDVEKYLESQAPHYFFNAESYPSTKQYKELKEFLGLDNKYDKQMTQVFEKSSEKTSSEKGRNRRCVWNINTKPFKEAHFAVYPEKLCEVPLSAGCPEGGIVLDPFFGSGTTGLVALKQNKKFVGIELNESYIKIAKERLKPYMEQRRLSNE